MCIGASDLDVDNELPMLKRCYRVHLLIWLSNKQLMLLLQQGLSLEPRSAQAMLILSLSWLPRSLMRPKEMQCAQGGAPTLHSVRQGSMMLCWAAQVS